MAGISGVTRADANNDQQRVGDAIFLARGAKEYSGPYSYFLHNPELAERTNQLGNYLRQGASISRRLAELAILITAKHWRAQFEWSIHVPLAEAEGIDAAAIEAIRIDATPNLDQPDDQAVFNYLTELYRDSAVSAATNQRALECLGTVGVVDLIGIASFYAGHADACNAFQPEIVNKDVTPLPE